MELGIFKNKKLHKVKGKQHVTFMIIPDPTKNAKVVKIPKWIRFPILILAIAIVLGVLSTISYIAELESKVAVDRLNIQTSKYTIYDKDDEISELELTNREHYDQLQTLHQLAFELDEKLDSLETYREYLDSKLNSTDKTTDKQPSEALEVLAADKIEPIANDPEVFEANISSISVGTVDDYDLELQQLINEVQDAIAEVDMNQDVYGSLDSQLDIMIPFWEAYPKGWPVNGSYVTDAYGWRRHPITYANEFHKGIDLAASYEPVYATGKGVVIASKYESGYGYAVTIDHGYGYVTKYAHNSQLLVSKGDVVERGDVICVSGNSGISTGPHLHYEVRYNGVTQNPIDYMNEGNN